MDPNTDEVCERLRRIGLHLSSLGRICAKYCWDISSGVLENHVRSRNSTKVAAGTGVRHPGRWSIHATSSKHIIRRVGWCGCGWVEKRVGPVGEGNAEVSATIWIKVAE